RMGYGPVLLFQLMSCVLAGGYAGDLVFSREVRRRTFTDLQLLAADPPRCLAAKLLPSMLLTALVWSAGIPLAICCTLLEFATATAVVRGSLIAAYAGIAALALPLVAAVEDMTAKSFAANPRRILKPEVVRGLVATLATMLIACLLVMAWGTPDRWPLFGRRVPVEWVAGPVLAALLATALAVSRERLVGEGAERGAAIMAGACLVMLYVAALGALWAPLPWWAKWPIGVGFPIFLGVADLIGQTSTGGKSEPHPAQTPAQAPAVPMPSKPSAWAVAELAWIVGRWDNPVLLRDLRGGLRGKSIRQKLLATFLWAPVSIGLLWLLLKFFSVGIGAVATNFFQALLHGGSAAGAFWGKEKKSGSLPLLLLSPLTSREILVGRMAASILCTVPALMLSATLFVGMVVWLTATRFPFAAPIALGLAPVLVLEWLVMGCCGSTPGMTSQDYQTPVLVRAIQVAEVLLVPGTVVAVLAAQRFGPAMPYVVALTFAVLHGGFVRFQLGHYAARFDAYRQSDVAAGTE
ncbi:MAG: hypothetical protein K0Q72_5301, partial [Armatimonadetes bacterium]|nr:hypothetical protein [Armatimonadota bacterium]